MMVCAGKMAVLRWLFDQLAQMQCTLFVPDLSPLLFREMASLSRLSPLDSVHSSPCIMPPSSVALYWRGKHLSWSFLFLVVFLIGDVPMLIHLLYLWFIGSLTHLNLLPALCPLYATLTSICSVASSHHWEVSISLLSSLSLPWM